MLNGTPFVAVAVAGRQEGVRLLDIADMFKSSCPF